MLDNHILHIPVAHPAELFLCNPPHTFIVQQGRIRLHKAYSDVPYRFIHGMV